MNHDLYNNTSTVQSLTPAERTASANGSSADLNGFGSALVVIAAGAWTDGSHTFVVQESDDDSSFAAVADADLQGTEPAVTSAGTASQVYEIGYAGNKRYLRVATTVSGTTSGAVYGASIVRGHPHTASTR